MNDNENKNVTSEELEKEALETVETEESESTAIITTEEKTEENKEETKVYDGPTVKVSVKYDYTTLKYYNMFSMVYKRHYPILYLVLGLLCLAYVVFQIVTLVTSGTELTASSFIMPGIFCIFVVYSIYLFINFENSIDKNLTMHFNQSPVITTIEATITKEGITVKSSKNPEEPYKYDWCYITNIYEIPQYYYFYVNKQPIIITKDPNAIMEGDSALLKELIDEQIQTKPYKLIDKEILKKPVTYVHQEQPSTDVSFEENVSEDNTTEEENKSDEENASIDTTEEVSSENSIEESNDTEEK